VLFRAHQKGLAWLSALLLVIFALMLRLPGFDGRALWLDELWRVNFILEPGSIKRYWSSPDSFTAITAPMYLALNKLIGLFSATPSALRLSSLLPGVASVVLASLIAFRAGGSLAWACAAGALFAANANFIQYSNEFKPYMFEVMLHLACLLIWLDLIIAESSTRWQWVKLSVVLVCAAFCAANIVFVLPAMALSLLDKVLTRERDKVKLVVGVFSLAGVVAVGLYLFVWSYGSDKGLTTYWGAEFFDASRESYWKFSTTRVMGMWRAAFSTVRATLWMNVVSLLGLICAVMICWRHWPKVAPVIRASLIFGVTILLTLLLLNWIGLWPIGEIRPNQFIYAIIGMLWFIILAVSLPLWGLRLLGILVLVVVASGVFKTDPLYLDGLGPPKEQTNYVWASFTTSTEVGQMILDECKTHPVKVFLNPAMFHANHYFSAFEAGGGKPNVLMGPCSVIVRVPDAYSDPIQLRSRLVELGATDSIVWHAYSHLNESEVRQLRQVALEFGPLVYEQSFMAAGLFAIATKKQ
jgi:hypothetical protein